MFGGLLWPPFLSFHPLAFQVLYRHLSMRCLQNEVSKYSSRVGEHKTMIHKNQCKPHHQPETSTTRQSPPTLSNGPVLPRFCPRPHYDRPQAPLRFRPRSRPRFASGSAKSMKSLGRLGFLPPQPVLSSHRCKSDGARTGPNRPDFWPQ